MSWAPDQPRPGFWMVRCCKRCPPVAARISWEQTIIDPVSDEPMVRSPFLVGHIGLELSDWRDVWRLVEYCEASPEQRREMASPPLSARPPRFNRSPGLMAAPMPIWQRQRARRITGVEYATELEWLSWAAQNAPTHHDFLFRRPVNPATAQVPRFT